MNIGSDGPAKRVLVVDDSSVNLKITAALIRRAGFLTGMAETAEDALKQIAVDLPDLIVTDLRLPGMDGLEVARQMRKDNKLKDVLLIALTGYGQDDDRRRSEEAGFNAHLVKPVDLATLQELLTQSPFAADQS